MNPIPINYYSTSECSANDSHVMSSSSFISPNNEGDPLIITSIKNGSTCCGWAEAETDLSSNNNLSHSCSAQDGRSITDRPTTCLDCLLPMVKSGEEQHSKNCFITIDHSSKLEGPGDSVFFPHGTAQEVSLGNAECKLLPLTISEIAMARLTPRTLHSKASETRNGLLTMASTSNTLHRRSDISQMGLFTAQTLDAIYSCPSEVIYEETGTPCDRDSEQDDAPRLKYQTPSNRGRIDSDSFRRTMEVVTCEKRSDISGDSDISSIAIDAFFSPTLEVNNDGKNITKAENSSPVSLLVSSTSRKWLVFDPGNKHDDMPIRSRCATTEEAHIERNQCRLFSPMTISKKRAFPSPAFGISVMSLLQSIINFFQFIPWGSRGCQQRCPRCRRRKYSSENDKIPSPSISDDIDGCLAFRKKENIYNENGPLIMSSLPPSSTQRKKKDITSQFQQTRDQCANTTFLPYSSTFLKELRRSGHKSGVIIQGWVAYRAGDVVSWTSIINNPKRNDFRYIILLQDKLYMFKSRKKKKKKKTISSILQAIPIPQENDVTPHDCTIVKLCGGNTNVSVRTNLVSKEYGNEVCIYDSETNEIKCSLLPIPMPQHIFLNRHKSRLKKGEVLKRIFLDNCAEPNSHDALSSYAPSSIVTLMPSGDTSVTSNDDVGANTARAITKGTIDDNETNENDNVNDVDNNDHASVAATEQYDVSRHILFAIDAAIRIPLFPISLPNHAAFASQKK